MAPTFFGNLFGDKSQPAVVIQTNKPRQNRMKLKRVKYTETQKALAVELIKKGWTQRKVAKKIGCTNGNLTRWCREAEKKEKRDKLLATRGQGDGDGANVPAPAPQRRRI